MLINIYHKWVKLGKHIFVVFKIGQANDFSFYMFG